MSEDVIKIIAGSTLPIKFIAINEGIEFPLEDVNIKFVITSYGDLTPILTKNTANFEIVGNTALLKLSANDTIDLSGTYEYQITYTDDMGNADIREGQILVKPNKR